MYFIKQALNCRSSLNRLAGCVILLMKGFLPFLSQSEAGLDPQFLPCKADWLIPHLCSTLGHCPSVSEFFIPCFLFSKEV